VIKFLETKSNTITDTTLSEKFHNKKVLVIGAGPSTNEVKWQLLEYDTIVTTTHFYLNETIKNLPLSHVTLSEIIDFNNKDLYHFLDNNPNCTLAFEPKPGRPFYTTDVFKNFEKKYRERLIYYNTNIDTLEGAAGRLAYFVSSFGPSELYYIGIDGKSPNKNQDPIGAFRPIYGDTDGYSYERFKESHMKMANALYEQSKKTNTKLFNLGEGLHYNCSSDYSKVYYPLPPSILNIIN